MTATEMEEVLKKLDHRLTNIEQILPTLATKEDLKVFATKEDVKASATKEDLKAYATKEDLKAYASKEDLKAYPTREEVKELFSEAKRHAVVLFEKTQEQLEIIAAHVADISQRLPPRR
jgi:sulfur transfer complex TusBCD TusB component (DsrH family)